METSILFKNAIILTDNFLKNEYGLDLKNPRSEIIYRNYYFNICNAIADLHYLKPTRENIEEFIKIGNVGIGEKFIISKVETEVERKYLFLMAQTRQLEYDIVGGRGSMIRGEDGKFNLCPDTWEFLNLLGLIDNGTLFKGKKPWIV